MIAAAGCRSPVSPVPQGKTENTKDKKVTCTVESEKGGRKKMGVERCPQRHSHSHKGSSSKQQVRSGPAAQGRERERERAHTGKGITGATTWRRGRPSQQAHNDDTGHNKLLKPTAFRCRWHPPRYPPTWAALPPCICIPRPPENACVCSRCVACARRPPARPPGLAC